MEHKLLKAILSNSKIEEKGLFSGEAGVCLALCMLKSNFHLPLSNEYIDKRISDIVKSLDDVRALSFDKGLTGIGWTISMLYDKGFISGDIDNILFNSDAALYRELNGSEGAHHTLSCSNGLLGYLIYIMSRLKDSQDRKDSYLTNLNEKSFRLLIDGLYALVPSAFPLLSKDVYISILWEYPIFFVLMRKAMELGIYSRKIVKLIDLVKFYLRSSIPYYNINKLSLSVSITYLNEILMDEELNFYKNGLMGSIDFQQIENEIDNRIININEGWFLCLFIHSCAIMLMKKSCPQYEKIVLTRNWLLENFGSQFQTFLFEKPAHDVTLINGISGISLLYSIYPKVFNISYK
ncbi:MAG: hypothetical protein ILA39_06540 [Bacteroidaceae bacterium]|nr:hypothetical protein [Bacteroidaceae bacterium]